MEIKKTQKIFIAFFSIFGIAAIAFTCRAVDYDFIVQDITASPASPPANVESEIKVKIKLESTNDFTDSGIFNSYAYSFDNFELRERILPEVSAAKPIKPNGTIYYNFKGIFRKVGYTALSFDFNQD